MKLFFIFFALISLSACAAGQKSSTSTHTSNIEHTEYTYDMKLDIKKVLSSTDISSECGVVTVKMAYLNSNDEVKGLSYRALGGGCIDN